MFADAVALSNIVHDPKAGNWEMCLIVANDDEGLSAIRIWGERIDFFKQRGYP